MRIALIGEFSRLHNSLKEGLVQLGHEVVLINNGDGFKKYPADYSHKAFWCETKLGNIPRQIIYRLINFDIATIERGIRFYFLLPKIKSFDVVQLINEKPIQTTSRLELFLLKKIFKQNKNVFLLCSGIDYSVAKHLLSKKERYSIMNPHFDAIMGAKNEIDFILSYTTKMSLKIHAFILKKCSGIIASDIDYINPNKEYSKYLGLIPNPINLDKNPFSKNQNMDKIVIFLGINPSTYYTKGISFFEKALALIDQKYKSRIEIIIVKNIPYNQYIKLYDSAHILLDQVYGYDQGYNALEAMAKGKVVFTGAEIEFLKYYNLQEDEVAINALADVNYLVEKISFLIENPLKLIEIGKNARNFIEREHDYVNCAAKYIKKWKSKS